MRLALLGLVQRVAAAASPLRPVIEVDRIAREHQAGVIISDARRYRVDATVELLSVPLVSKQNVGGGWAMVEQAVSGSSRTTVLQFSGGSWPNRLKGFKRFGMTQEVVHEEDGAILESAYLRFMTSAAEKSFNQARKAFEDPMDPVAITVAHGGATRSGYASALDRLKAPSHYTWSNTAELMEEVREQVSPSQPVSLGSTRDSAFPTFLHAVRAAVLAGAESCQSTFAQNAKLYRLRTRLASVNNGLTAVKGWIAEQGSTHEFEFRVWFDPRDSSTLPVRIEFRPTSFLRLVFEDDPAVGGPEFPCLLTRLLPKERA